MKKLFLFLLLVFLSCSCYKKSEGIAVTTNSEFHVEFLFELDGCKVYRFSDGGYTRYFTSCKGSVSWEEKHGKTEVPYEVPTN